MVLYFFIINRKTNEKNNEPPTSAIRNAGESASRKVSASIPPKLRFDVFEMKIKTQSIALATDSTKRKGSCLEIPHYA